MCTHAPITHRHALTTKSIYKRKHVKLTHIKKPTLFSYTHACTTTKKKHKKIASKHTSHIPALLDSFVSFKSCSNVAAALKKVNERILTLAPLVLIRTYHTDTEVAWRKGGVCACGHKHACVCVCACVCACVRVRVHVRMSAYNYHIAY